MDESRNNDGTEDPMTRFWRVLEGSGGFWRVLVEFWRVLVGSGGVLEGSGGVLEGSAGVLEGSGGFWRVMEVLSLSRGRRHLQNKRSFSRRRELFTGRYQL